MGNEDLPRIVGCMTGAANDVSDHLALIDLPAKVTRFIHRQERLTFGRAGIYQARGEEDPGLWCEFIMPEWTEALKMTSAQIIHIRQRLIDDGLIWYEAQEGRKGIGRIGWNLAFDAWKPLQPGYRAWGGKREGAGRPKKLIDNLNIVTPDFVDNLNYEQATSGATAITPAAGLATGRNQDINENYSSRQRNLFKSSTKNGTFADAGASPEAAPKAKKSSAVITKNKEEETYTDTIVSGADAPSSPWPPRQTHEKSDLDYYQRIIREHEKERVALLVRLAHERIHVPLESSSYARIGALAKKPGIGAGLLVEYILLAASKHIEGDPLNMLTKIVTGQLRRQEGSNGHYGNRRNGATESHSAQSATGADLVEELRAQGFDVSLASQSGA